VQLERLDDSTTLSFFYDSLADLTSLTKLRLAGHINSPNALVPLSSALSGFLKLKHLELPGHKANSTCPLVNPLCSTLLALTKLTLLNLKAFHVPTEGYEVFEGMLENLPELSVLKMSHDYLMLSFRFPNLLAAQQLKQLQIAAKVHLHSVASSVVASIQVLLRCLPTPSVPLQVSPHVYVVSEPQPVVMSLDDPSLPLRLSFDMSSGKIE
jgi:hypothetical protein